MKKLLTIIHCLIIASSANAQQLYAPGTVQGVSNGSNNVGIGLSSPEAKLDILGEASNLFRARVSSAPADYLGIENSTLAPNQFIPGITGYHVSDNRQALYLTGTIESANDVGNEPLVVFDARQSGAPVVSRPLFAWDSYSTRKMTLSASGSLHIFGPTGNGETGIIHVNGSGANASLRIGVDTEYAWIQSHNSRPLYINDLGNNTILNTSGGNVGIGTASPEAKLTVAGEISCREVTVSLEAGSGPDYVFESDYNLLPLTETESYIKKNKHLPEVPSAKEMEAEGLDLKEMNLLLLKKVEELTLHLIAQNKKIEAQAELLRKQDERLGKLEH